MLETVLGHLYTKPLHMLDQCGNHHATCVAAWQASVCRRLCLHSLADGVSQSGTGQQQSVDVTACHSCSGGCFVTSWSDSQGMLRESGASRICIRNHLQNLYMERFWVKATVCVGPCVQGSISCGLGHAMHGGQSLGQCSFLGGRCHIFVSARKLLLWLLLSAMLLTDAGHVDVINVVPLVHHKPKGGWGDAKIRTTPTPPRDLGCLCCVPLPPEVLGFRVIGCQHRQA